MSMWARQYSGEREAWLRKRFCKRNKVTGIRKLGEAYDHNVKVH
jgi:hypothetical protein